MKRLISLGGVCLIVPGLSGCSGGAKPNLINGKYYMGGDSKCKRYRVISNSRIMCQDSKGRDMGWRDAMTNQQISMWQHNQSQSNYDYQQQMNRNNYNYQQQRNRSLYQYGY